jgi:DNA-binding MarR family transcriptional regulator
VQGMTEEKRDHVLRKPLEDAVGNAMNSTENLTKEEVVEHVLQALSANGLIQYAPKGTLALLSAAGRTLVCVASMPGATLRDLSLVLGVSESTVAKSIGNLVSANVIARTKVKGRNTYQLVSESVKNHPDITRFNQAISRMLEEAEKTPVIAPPDSEMT